MRQVWVFLLAAMLLPVAVAHGPTRQKVTVEREIAASAERCWAMVSDFAALHVWLPPVSSTELLQGDGLAAGSVRRLQVGDKHIEETLKSLKSERMMLKYKISQGDVEVLPVTNYSSSLSVKAEGAGCKVKWLGAFYRGYPNNDPPDHLNDATAITAVEGLYNVGLDNLKTVLEGQ